MLQNSFIFLDKVSSITERKIWQQNVHTWDEFIEAKRLKGFSGSRKTMHALKLQKAKKNLEVNNLEFFRHHLPKNQHWRLYEKFKDEAVYLDIETTGFYGGITVIGLYDGRDTKIMVRGQNLDKDLLLDTLKQYKLLLTFNGSSFDIPVINRYFGCKLDMPHIDLRHVCAKIGLHGGLKHIEKVLGIKRADDVEGVSGGDAVYLWHMYKSSGDRKYLELLVKYNEEDIINLKPLAEYAVGELWKQVRGSPRDPVASPLMPTPQKIKKQ